MICILCGGSLHQNTEINNEIKILGYKCKSCGEEWPIADNKNFEYWAMKHIRALEQQVQTFESQIKELLNYLKKK